MKTSQEGLDKLIAREGKRNKAYKDTKGIWTIGVGHTGPDVSPTSVWTDEKVQTTFAKDILWAEDAVNNAVKVHLAQNQFDALVSFVFNVGATDFKNRTLLRVLNLGNYTEAAKQMDRWVIPPEITSRRMSEKAQFLGL